MKTRYNTFVFAMLCLGLSTGLAAMDQKKNDTPIEPKVLAQFLYNTTAIGEFLKQIHKKNESIFNGSKKLVEITIQGKPYSAQAIKDLYLKLTRKYPCFEIYEHSEEIFQKCYQSAIENGMYVIGSSVLKCVTGNCYLIINKQDSNLDLFGLFHEFGHIYHEHLATTGPDSTPEERKKAETEADRFAYEKALLLALQDKDFSFEDFVAGAKEFAKNMLPKELNFIRQLLAKVQNDNQLSEQDLILTLNHTFHSLKLNEEKSSKKAGAYAQFYEDNKKRILKAKFSTKPTTIDREFIESFLSNKKVVNHLLRITHPEYPTILERFAMANEYLKKYRESIKRETSN